MDKREVLQVVAMLEVAYPHYYSKLSDEQFKNLVSLWTVQFKDDNANLVANVINGIIATDLSPFPPSIAMIKSKALDLLGDKSITEQEAWNIVLKASSNSSFNAKKEYDNLPEDIKTLCSPSQLREWGLMNIETLNSVVASNFMRSYKVRVKESREQKLLPSSVKLAIGSIVELMKLEDHKE